MRMRHRRPFIRLKSGASLDGRDCAREWREQMDHERRGARRRAALARAERRGAHQRGNRARRRSATRRAYRNPAPADARGARSTSRVAQDGACPRAARRRAGVRCADRRHARRARARNDWAMRASSAFACSGRISICRQCSRVWPSSKSTTCWSKPGRGSRAPCLPPAWSTNGCCTSRRNCWARRRNRLAALARLTRLDAAPEFELLDSKVVGPDLRLRLQPHKERIMFTGIVQEVGIIRRIETRGGAPAAPEDRRIEVAIRTRSRASGSTWATASAWTASASRSPALGAGSFHADVSGETLRVTTLGAKARRRARESRARAARR